MNALRTLARTPAKSKIATTLQSRIPQRCISTQTSQAPYLLQDKDNGLGFIRSNPRTPKPRDRGVTEVRGPYYSAYGKRHWQDVLDIMGHHIDGLKFAGGSFSLMPEKSVRELVDMAHKNDVYVSTASRRPSILNPADTTERAASWSTSLPIQTSCPSSTGISKSAKMSGTQTHPKRATAVLNPRPVSTSSSSRAASSHSLPTTGSASWSACTATA
jgi:hypothetical protein